MPDTDDVKVRGIPILRERQCRYEERRDADAVECDTERAGMPILKENDADTKRERYGYRKRAMPMSRESNADAEGEQCQCRGRAMPRPKATR
jgi:hypothetical protein